MIILLLQRRYCSSFIVMLVMIWSTGCSTMPLNVWESQRVVTASKEHPVIELVGIWQTAEGQDQKNLPCRGFGGQILFFAAGSKTPVRVQGNVSIYVFDDMGTSEEQAKPYHQYDFTSEQWACFFRDSTLGSCYQVFVPYTRPGGFEADCSIRVKFTPEEGSPVYSKVATINIRGVKRQTELSRQKLIKESSALVRHAEGKSNSKEQLVNSIIKASDEQFLQDVIPTHTTESMMNKKLQAQRLSKLEQLLETYDPDPQQLEQRYEISHSKKALGRSVINDFNQNQSEQMPDDQLLAPSSQLQEIFGVE